MIYRSYDDITYAFKAAITVGRRLPGPLAQPPSSNQPATSVTSGPYLFMDAIVVDKSNVKDFLK